MCALRAHIKLSIFENIFSRIEKVLRAHISKILKTKRNMNFKIKPIVEVLNTSVTFTSFWLM